jgi:DNA repair photolyase
MKINTCSYRPVITPCRLDAFDCQIDTYIGCEHYCYYCYVLNRAETDWTREILVHRDIRSQLEAELASLAPQKIYFGYRSDPYQPCEARYRQTREALALLAEKGFTANILTKSDLVTRDIDLLRDMNGASVSVSVAFNDNDTRRRFEARTPDTEARIDALRKLRRAGIATNALICPVIPYITDVRPLIDMLAPHTDAIWIFGLSIDGRSDPNGHNLLEILERHFADRKHRVERAVFAKADPFWTGLRIELQDLARDTGLDLRIHV